MDTVKTTRVAIWVALSFFSSLTWAQQSIQTIYGSDDRKEFYQIRSERLRTLARKSVALVSEDYIPSDKSRMKRFRGDKYGEYSHLCPDQKYILQPTIAFCSGVLIGFKHVLTAGHCISESGCQGTHLVLDFMVNSSSEQSEIAVSSDNIYSCAKVIQRKVTRSMDFAILELDRPVRDREKVLVGPQPESVDSLITIGYPQGIPMKVALNGSVRSEAGNYIVANLDVLSGNSGSPVYNASLELVGILIGGEKDYTFDRSLACYRERQCENGKCAGERVLKISAISTQMGALSSPTSEF